METVFISHAFKQTVIDQYIESNQKNYLVVQLCVSGRPNEIYLHEVIEMEEAQQIRETLSPCFKISGLLCMRKKYEEEAKTIFEGNKDLSYLIFYDFDFNTFKIEGKNKQYKIESRDWIGELFGLYTKFSMVCAEDKGFGFVADDFLKGKCSLIINNIPSLIGFDFKQGKITIQDSKAKDNIAVLNDVKKYNLNKDPFAKISDIPLFSINYITRSEADGELSQVSDFVRLKKITVDYLSYVMADDFAANHTSVLEQFFNRILENKYRYAEDSFNMNENDRLIIRRSTEKDANGKEIPSFAKEARLSIDFHPEKLRNVHFNILNTVSLKKYLVAPGYVYFHYNQDNFKDDGWGCAYRSLQTLISWFVINRGSKINVPSIPEIQTILTKIGDKPSTFVGSNEWIGSVEVSYILQNLLKIDSRIMHFESGSGVLNYLPTIKQHFETQKTPIMVGGSVLAYTLLGIAVDEDEPQNTQFLILDPHYKGKDTMKEIVNPKSKAVYWSSSKIFKSNAFYNFCCPQND